MTLTGSRGFGTRPPVPDRGAQSSNVIKISAGYGRLYVTGPAHRIALRLPGAALNERRAAVEVSLTLETLRSLRKQMGVTAERFARFCTPEVLAWARAAGQMEKTAKDLHERVATGWRMDGFPWADARAGTVAPEDEDESKLEMVNGRRVYKYRPPFDHQKVMATFGCTLDGTAFVADMGTSKTRPACESIRHLLATNQLQVVIVVCPKGVIKTWRDELSNWTPDVRFEVLQGTVAQRRKFIAEWQPTPLAPRVLVINYDVLYLLENAVQRLFSRVKGGLTLDEMHRTKNPQAKVSKAAMNLAQIARWRLGLTGTPVLQGVQDVWSQWYIVDLGVTFGSNFVQFRREFIDENPYTYRLEPKPGALETVGKLMRIRGLRYTKEECLDLPPKTYEQVLVEMTSKQAAAYREMEDWLVARLSHADVEDESFATAANQLVMILRLTQITSGFVPDENGTLHRFTPNPKLAELEEIVREQITAQQILVWARYTEDICSICERLRDLNPVAIAGEQAIPKIRQRGIDVPSREEAQDLFQSRRRRLIVANPGAGGEGLNLWRGSLAIYYSQGYSLKDRSQSEDRSHRSGSEIHSKVTYVDLMAANTIDTVVREALLAKKSVAAAVVDLRRHLGLE